MRTYLLPDETTTEDANEYGEAWSQLGDKLALALGAGWKWTGISHSYKLSMTQYATNRFNKLFSVNDLIMPIATAERLIKMWEDAGSPK
ncbi:hypothetical protein KKH23_08240 [Patescibacteria group bacterium]|nr:hypothetical protein [Patescibacteria group bacterium]MBU0847164.1 hypothetical protein [Patescibacteria group bacterium]